MEVNFIRIGKRIININAIATVYELDADESADGPGVAIGFIGGEEITLHGKDYAQFLVLLATYRTIQKPAK